MKKIYQRYTNYWYNKHEKNSVEKIEDSLNIYAELIGDLEKQKKEIKEEITKEEEELKKFEETIGDEETIKSKGEEIKKLESEIKNKEREKDDAINKYPKGTDYYNDIIKDLNRLRNNQSSLEDELKTYANKKMEYIKKSDNFNKFKKNMNEKIEKLNNKIKEYKKKQSKKEKKGEKKEEKNSNVNSQEQQGGGNIDVSSNSSSNTPSDISRDGPNMLKKFEEEFDKYENTYKEQLNDVEERLIEHEKSEEILERIKQYAEASAEQLHSATNSNLLHQQGDRNLILYFLGRRVDVDDNNKVRYNDDYNILDQADKKNNSFLSIIKGSDDYDKKFSLKEILGEKNNNYIAIYDEELGEDIPLEIDEERNIEILKNLDDKINKIFKNISSKDIKNSIDLLVNHKLNGITEKQFGDVMKKFKELETDRNYLQKQVEEWKKFKEELGDDDDQDIEETINKYKLMKEIADKKNTEYEEKMDRITKAYENMNKKIEHDTLEVEHMIKEMDNNIEFFLENEKQRRRKDKELEKTLHNQIDIMEEERSELLNIVNSKLLELERFRDGIGKTNEISSISDELEEIKQQLDECKENEESLRGIGDALDKISGELNDIETGNNSNNSQSGGAITYQKILIPKLLDEPKFLKTSGMNKDDINEKKEKIINKISKIKDTFNIIAEGKNSLNPITEIVKGGGSINLQQHNKFFKNINNKKDDINNLKTIYDEFVKTMENIENKKFNFEDFSEYIIKEDQLRKLSIIDEFMLNLVRNHIKNMSDDEVSSKLGNDFLNIDSVDNDKLKYDIYKNNLLGKLNIMGDLARNLHSVHSKVNSLSGVSGVSGGKLSDIDTKNLLKINDNLSKEIYSRTGELKKLKNKAKNKVKNKTKGGASSISTFNPYNVKDFMEQFGDNNFKEYIVENLSLNKAKVEQEYIDLQNQINASNMSVV